MISRSTRTDATHGILGIEAQALTAEEEMQDRLFQLEQRLFENGIFQAWMILLFFTLLGMLTWLTTSLGLPL